MKRKFIIFFAVSLSLSIAFAKDDKTIASHNRGRMFEKELNLSNDQLKKVKVIRQKYKADIDTKKKDVAAAHKVLEDGIKLPKKGNDYQAELNDKFKKLQSAQEDVQKLKFQMALEIREILTDNQIAKFADLREKMK